MIPEYAPTGLREHIELANELNILKGNVKF